MTLQPNFLPVGSIVEYNLGDKDFPNWSPTSLDWQDLKRLDENPGLFNCEHRGIKLTPEILTEWCGFETLQDGWFGFNVNNETVATWNIYDKCFRLYGSKVDIEFLHELQLLFLRMKTVLTATIK